MYTGTESEEPRHAERFIPPSPDCEARMSDPPFDPSKTVTFDLKHALVDWEGTPGVVLPSDELLAVCVAAGAEATEKFGRGIGRWMGHRVVGRFGGGKAVRAASLSAIVDHLGGEWAIAGLGAF